MVSDVPAGDGNIEKSFFTVYFPFEFPVTILLMKKLLLIRYVREAPNAEGSGSDPSQEQLAVDQIRKVMEIAEEQAAKAAALEQEKEQEKKKKEEEEKNKKDEVKPAVVPPSAEAAKNATTEDNKIMEELKKDQLIPEAVMANATIDDEDATAIKEENVEKCNKCLKPAYKFRHDGFCGKCSAQGVIDAAEAEDLTEAINCKKCLKPKFRARNEDLCKSTCAEEIAAAAEEAANKKAAAAEEAANKKPAAGEKKPSSGIKFGTTDMNPDDDDDEKDGEMASTTTTEEAPSTTTESEEVQLGPLGSLIKYLVVQNTYL